MKSNNLIRRSAAMLLAGLMAVSMSACGGSSASGNDSGDSQASSSGDTHKLSVVLKTTSSEYWSYVIAGRTYHHHLPAGASGRRVGGVCQFGEGLLQAGRRQDFGGIHLRHELHLGL